MNSFEEVTNKYFDITDRDTRQELLNLDESGQNSVLLGLTSKLYSMIIGKVDEIDFGGIPETKGDITKLHEYKQLKECISILMQLLDQYKQPTDSVEVISTALANLEKDKSLYQRGFSTKIDIIMNYYNLIALAIINSISYMIAVMVEFIKNPSDKGFSISLDKAGIARTKDSLVYENLQKFNKACASGQVNKAFESMIKSKVKNIAPILGISALLAGTLIAALIFNIIPIMRYLAYMYYNSRIKISHYFEIQAELIEMNIAMIENNEIKTVGNRKEVLEKQRKIAEKFRKWSNEYAIDIKETEHKTEKGISTDNKTYKVNDVLDTENNSSSDSLF